MPSINCLSSYKCYYFINILNKSLSCAVFIFCRPNIDTSIVFEFVIPMTHVFSAFCRYVKFYHLPEPIDDVDYFLTHVAKQHNLVMKVRSPSGQ